jgi:uncharacterized protein YehS (DUF1456 family)
VLRALIGSLELTHDLVVQILALQGVTLNVEELAQLVSAETAPTHCSDELLSDFLDGLITSRRGPRDAGLPKREAQRLTNNEALKKLRIAMNFREPQVLLALARGGEPLSKTELGGLFRKPGNKHYRPCSDQVLRAVIRGLNEEPEA